MISDCLMSVMNIFRIYYFISYQGYKKKSGGWSRNKHTIYFVYIIIILQWILFFSTIIRGNTFDPNLIVKSARQFCCYSLTDYNYHNHWPKVREARFKGSLTCDWSLFYKQALILVKMGFQLTRPDHSPRLFFLPSQLWTVAQLVNISSNLEK